MVFSLVGTSSSTETGSVGTGTVPWSSVGTVSAGDVALYLWIYLTGSTATDPGGFTLQGTIDDPNGSGSARLLSRICDGTESGNAVATSSGADKVVAVMGVYRGAHPTTPINAVQSQATTGTTSLPSPSATSTTAGVAAVTLFSSRVTTGPTTLTQSSPFTGRITRAPYTGGGSTAAALADNLTPYGASGTVVTPPNWTSNFSFTNSAWNTWTVLLAPAPAANLARLALSKRQAVKRASFY